jgi:hypothetical protein
MRSLPSSSTESSACSARLGCVSWPGGRALLFLERLSGCEAERRRRDDPVRLLAVLQLVDDGSKFQYTWRARIDSNFCLR